MTRREEIAAANKAAFEKPCEDCEGSGFQGDIPCGGCHGTGKHMWRNTPSFSAEPGAVETISYKVGMECEQEMEWERKKRREEREKAGFALEAEGG